MRGEHPILAFNRGMLSRLAMARTDIKRYAMSAEQQTNWMPRVLGSAMLRPGTAYLGTSKSNAQARYLDFVFSASDTALLELTNQTMRFWVADALVSRASVSTAVANGTFVGSLASWTDVDQTSTTSQWVAGNYMGLAGYQGASAGRRQAVTVAVGDRNVVHALRVVVFRGKVDVLVGSSAGGEEYFNVTLERGTHSLAFTPTGDISIDIRGFTEYESLVSQCTIEAAGTMELPTPWLTADMAYIRKDQSGDVVYLSCQGYQQRKIERRGTTSWSIVVYEPEDGPFRAQNVSATTISNAGIRGTTTLTASQPLFKSTHVGALFRLDSNGQDVDRIVTALNDVGDKIVVTGVGAARAFTVFITFDGGAVGTITLQRSIGDTGVWENTTTTYTATTTATFNDAMDNQIIAYRLKCTAFTTGNMDCQLLYRFGSIKGVVRIITVASSTSATASVLKTLGNLGTLGNAATLDWREGSWSDYRGWPSAVALSDGRLWWAGKDKFYGSVTDNFSSFDPDYEGDSAPIQRSVVSGPVDNINWMVSLDRMLAGTDGSVVVCQTNSIEDPPTPTNFQPKPKITQGSARVAPAKIDDTVVYIQAGGRRVLSVAPSSQALGQYAVEDLTQLCPEVTSSGIIAIGIQRQPDTRIHCVRADGTVAVMVYDKTEDVKCWTLVTIGGGLVEDVVVLPGSSGEDAVYYSVNRTISGTKRYLEKWAREDECIGGTTCKLVDSHIAYTGANLTHLEGQSVVGWYNGVAYPTAVVVSSGAAAGIPSGAVVGTSYEARFKSTKLAYLVQPGESGLAQRKRAHSISLVMADVHPEGIKFGQSFDSDKMDNLPLMEGYADVVTSTVYSTYNTDAIVLPGTWEVDARLCLLAASPRPATLLGAVVGMSSHASG